MAALSMCTWMAQRIRNVVKELSENEHVALFQEAISPCPCFQPCISSCVFLHYPRRVVDVGVRRRGALLCQQCAAQKSQTDLEEVRWPPSVRRKMDTMSRQAALLKETWLSTHLASLEVQKPLMRDSRPPKRAVWRTWISSASSSSMYSFYNRRNENGGKQANKSNEM